MLDVALAPTHNLIRYTDTGGLLERPDQLQDRHAAACAEIEDLERLCGLPIDEPTDGLHMCTSQIDDVDIVSDTGAVGRVVVVAKDTQLGADPGGRLSEVRHEVLRRTRGAFADLG